MQHEEQDPRHREHQRHRREQYHQMRHQDDDHFHDFSSRWSEPAPPIDLNRYNWQPRNVGRFERTGGYHREEWPNDQRYRRQPQRYQHHPDQHYHQMGEQQHREPIWRQRDVHFDPSNQRVEDRWFEDPTMPHPQQRPPRHYDGFWEDYED